MRPSAVPGPPSTGSITAVNGPAVEDTADRKITSPCARVGERADAAAPAEIHPMAFVRSRAAVPTQTIIAIAIDTIQNTARDQV